MLKLLAKPLIEERRKQLFDQVEEQISRGLRPPHLSVVLVGDDPASKIYVGNKGKAAEACGFTHETINFPASASAEEVKKKILELNANPGVDGILIQRPLPKHFSEKEAIFWVSPEKDVDCLHPENIGLLVSGDPRFLPCTPGGIILLLEYYRIPVSGKIACVIGRSSIVGKPMASLLLSHNATVIQVHRGTKHPDELCKQADIVIVAAGARGLLKREWLKEGAVVVDVGIHRNEEGKVVGDVDVASVGDFPSALTPVPGGVGPMTIQVLLENTARAANRSRI